MTMLFSQMDRLEWHDDMISLIKVGQLCGHSCFSMEMRTRLSLFRRVRWDLRVSSELEHWMMNWTTKFRMPACQNGGQPASQERACVAVPLTLALVSRKNLPSGHDDAVEHLEAQVYRRC